MCYTHSKDERDLEREARRITEVRLMEGKLAIGMRTISVVEEERKKKRRSP